MRFLPEQLAGLPESSDRRARVRRNPSEVTCLELGEGNGGIVLNVSETGIAIAVAQTILDDHFPCLSFRLPKLDRTFLAEGEIVWRSESSKSAGLRFVNLDERDRVQIRNWIRAEIVSTEFETALDASPVAAKPVLIMPSPRKAASTWAQSEAERDEARAAEFDRMFPSETTLTLQAQAPVEIVEPEFNFLAESTEIEDVEIAAEAFHAAQEEHRASDETEVSEAALGEMAANSSADLEFAEEKTARELDWHEKWELFHRERENLERARAHETILELPAPFSAPLPEPPAEQHAEVGAQAREELPHAPTGSERISAPPLAGNLMGAWNSSSAVMPRESGARGGMILGSSLLGTQLARQGEDRIYAAPVKAAAAAGPTNEKNPLSIAALCIVLVTMCFILGYAIQPGAFQFAKSSFTDTPAEAVTPDAHATAAPVMPTAGQATTGQATDPTGAQQDATSSATSANAGIDETPAAAPEKKNPLSAATKTLAVPEVESSVGATPPAKAISPAEKPAVSSASTVRENEADEKSANAAVEATPTPTTSTPSSVPSSAPATPRPSVSAAPAPAPAPAGAAAGATTPAAAHESVTPVSFFPVTAPSEGAPPKLMQLPEETISETPSIVVRSHQFLFVPALPGPESEHPLQRVHLGDRMVEIAPNYPAQALEKMQGGSVHLRTTIGTDGLVVDVQPISGPTNLIPAAVSAVRQWRYKPTDIDGKPIAIEEDIVIEFRPRREVVAAR
jgi:TonB family protein